MVKFKEPNINARVKRIALVVEVVVVLLYEHVPAVAQMSLLGCAVIAGIAAAVAFMSSGKEDACEESDVTTDAAMLAKSESSHEFVSKTYISSEHPIWVQHHSQVVSVSNFDLKPLRFYQESLKNYSKMVDLGTGSDWRASELSEVMKAVTSISRRFTVELTNSDSILIHCEPMADSENIIETTALPILEASNVMSSN